MKHLTTVAATTASLLFLTGCSNTPEVMEKGAYDINNRHIVEYSAHNEENDMYYYYRPNHTWSYKLDANNAHINSVTSSNLLVCNENDIWFISLDERDRQAQIRYRYLISLAKSQLDDMKDDPSYIPRKDSAEFHELTKVDTELAQKGLIGCQKQISKEEAEKVLPHTERK